MFDVARKSFQLLKSSAWGPPAIRTAPEFRFVTWHPDGERVTFTGADGDLDWMPRRRQRRGRTAHHWRRRRTILAARSDTNFVVA